MPPAASAVPTLPALRCVQVAEGLIHGEYIVARDPKRQRQARLMEAFARAVGPDGRVPLKHGGTGAVVGPVLEFVNLANNTEERTAEKIIRFTRDYGPLVWDEAHTSVISRPVRTHERQRGVAGPSGRPSDRREWNLSLAEFWREQQRFRTLVRLVTAIQSAPERLVQLLREGIDVLPEIRAEFGRGEGLEGDSDAQYANAIAYFDGYESTSASTLRAYAQTIRVGELVARALNDRARGSEIVFDADHGFRCAPQITGVLDLLYFLVADSLPTFRFCANCGAVYFKNRPDKNTCSQRCAKLLGNRKWARAHPEANQRAKRKAVVKRRSS